MIGRPIVRAALSAAAVVVALGATGYFGNSFWHALFGAPARTASARDAVESAARHDVAVLTTLDYRKAERDLGQWQQVTTGALHTKLKRSHDPDAKNSKQSKSVATCGVSSVAVTKIGARYDTAEVMVAAKIRVDRDGKRGDVSKVAFTVDMSRTGDGWKASALNTVGGGAT